MGHKAELKALLQQFFFGQLLHLFCSQRRFQNPAVFQKGIVDVPNEWCGSGCFLAVVVRIAAIVIAEFFVGPAVQAFSTGKTFAFYSSRFEHSDGKIINPLSVYKRL
jgi:hypothetical protein